MTHLLAATLALLASFTLACAQPADIRQGLVAYWPLDETDGTITPDFSAFQHQLTLVNMDGSNFVPGRWGNAAQFNGTDEILSKIYTAGSDIGLPIYGARRYTVMMWVKGVGATQGGTGTGDRRIFAEGSTANNNPIFDIGTDSAAVATRTNVIDMFIRGDAGGTAAINHVKSRGMPLDGNWHHIAWVENDGAGRLYIDGQLDATVFNYARPVLTLNTVSLGGLQRAATGNFFAGMIDDAAIWERPLSQAEVQQVMTNSLQTPIPPLPPYLRVEPTDRTRALGDWVTFRAEAVGLRPITYQWLRNGVEIPNATNSTYSLFNLTPAESDTYSVRATNPNGPTEKSFVLTVLADPPADVRLGLVSYWPLDDFNVYGDAMPDLYSHNDFFLRSSNFWDLVFAQYNLGLAFDGIDQRAVRLSGFPTYKASGYSVAMWVNANGTNQSDRRFFAESSTNNNTPLFTLGTHTTGVDGTVRVFIRNDANATLVARQSTRPALDGTWHHVVWTDANGNGRLYIDGVLDESDFAYTPGPMTLDQTAIGAIVRATVSAYFTGALDEVAVWSRVLSFTEIQEIRNQGIPGPLGVIPPEIIDQPLSQFVLTRTRVTLSFTASGTSPLSIQWRKGAQDLDNQTNSTLVFPSITLGNAGDYSAVVENSAGRATTDVATITVALRPDPPTDLRVDFNNTGEEDATTTELGFQSFAIPQPGLGPFKRTYGGADLTVSGVAVNLESRRRATPTNNAAFTEEKLLLDFVFARDAVVGDGMDLLVEFMEPNTPYDVAIWSFDTGSATARISDWSANGTLVREGYTMVNTDLPTDNLQKQIQFVAVSDATGKILIEGRRNPTASAAINVFVNALRVSKRELRITKLEVSEFDMKLTFGALRPGTTHRLEEKASLTDAQWTEVPNVTFGGSGMTIEATFSNPGEGRFYRVVETP